MTPQPDRDAALTRAASRFEALLHVRGEAICIASLPLMVEEIAGEEAGGDADLEAELVAQLRRRAGLSV